MQKNSWTPKEDKALLEIVQNRKITQWALVARIISQEFNISGRTGKQCRQRWFNQLNPTLDTQTFTKEEEDLLFAEQNRIGNKWAKICGIFPNRSDNFVKNHFYSTFRKAYRKVNRQLLVLKGREFKLIKNVVVNRILLCAQEKFQQKTDTHPSVIELAIQIKNRLLPFAHIKKLEKEQEADLLKLVELIGVFKFSEANVTKKKNLKKRKCVYMTAKEHDDEIYKTQTNKRRSYSRSSSDQSSDLFVPDQKVEPYPENNFHFINPFENRPINNSFPMIPAQPPQSDQTTSQMLHPEAFIAPPKPNLQNIFLGYVPVFFNPSNCSHFFPNGAALQPHQLPGLFSNNMMPPMMMPPPVNPLPPMAPNLQVKAEIPLADGMIY